MARAFSLTCTPAAIAEGSKCLECLSDAQLKALEVYFMDLTIAGIESTTPRTADELITLGKCYCDADILKKRMVYRVYLLWVLADMFYDATPETVADLVEAIKCLKCSDKIPGIEIAILCDLIEAVYTLSAPV